MSRFPPVSKASADGLIAVGGDLSVPTLLDAYTHGIFPWPVKAGAPVPWFAPSQRAVLDLSDLKVPRSFRQLMKRTWHRITVNHAFEQVMNCCANHPYRGQETWIFPEVIAAYTGLHKAGFACSVEAWDEKGNLGGGFYGVGVGKFFAGESMFYHQSGFSRLALFHFSNFLREQGVLWIDCQVLNPFFSSLGGREISRARYMERLGRSLQHPGPLVTGVHEIHAGQWSKAVVH